MKCASMLSDSSPPNAFKFEQDSNRLAKKVRSSSLNYTKCPFCLTCNDIECVEELKGLIKFSPFLVFLCIFPTYRLFDL